MPIKLTLPAPQPKQKLFMQDHHRVVIFGGARGGGKSFAIDEKSTLACGNFPKFTSTIVRREWQELKDNHIKPLCDMLKVGTKDAVAVYRSADKELVFPNRSVIRFRQCNNETALGKIQGQQCDFLFIDEATNFPEDWLKKMFAIVRGTNGYPKRIYMTCNPSGIGMGYIKRLIERRFVEGETPEDYSFIQSLLTDNEILMEKDPEYQKFLDALPPKLRQAWRFGDWNSLEGMFFEDLRLAPDLQKCVEAGITTEEALEQRRWTHVIKPFDIPAGWNVYRSYDFGYGKPFSLGWWAVDFDGTIYRILELYGCTKTPNEGVMWTPAEQFTRIAEIEREHPYLRGRKIYGVADPSIWDGSRGIPIVEEAEKRGIYFEKGRNERIAGWMQVHERLKFDDNGFAKMYFFNNCEAIIRTMPLMMYDEHKPEDLDTDLEDHACDDVRYFCMSRPLKANPLIETYTPMIDPLDQFKTGRSSNNIDRFMAR